MKKPYSQSGFTLLELLVVVTIIAMLMAFSYRMYKTRFGPELQRTTRQLQTILQHTYYLATVNHVTYRVVFDMEAQSYFVEEGPKLVAKSNLSQLPEEEKKQEDEKKGDANKSETPTFTPVQQGALSKAELNPKVRLWGIFVEGMEAEKKEGVVYLYIFPKGFMQNGVIYLSDEYGKQISSLVINPLNATLKVESEYISPIITGQQN